MLQPNLSTGLIEATGLTFLPDYYDIDPSWQTLAANKPASTAWYNTLENYLNGPPGNASKDKTPNVTVDYLWNNRDKYIPASTKNIDWPSAVIAALGKFIPAKQAEALGGWLCGGYQYDGWFGLSKTAFDASDFLDAENCYGYFNPTVRISDCLLALKSSNIAAFDWAVRAASAKAANKIAHELIMYNKTIEAEKKAVAKVVTDAVDVVKSAAQGAADTASITSFLLRNIWWTAPLGIVGFVLISEKLKKVI